MSRADTWMPLYIGDYLSDTMHLNGAEHGAYLLLLMHQWRSGPLPDDDRQLAAISRTDAATWKRIGSTVRKFFAVTPDGLSQKRLAAERAKADGITAKRAEAGKRGASSRWSSDADATDGGSDSEGGAGGKPMANAIREPKQNDGPSPSQLERKKEPPSPPSVARSPRGSRLPPDWQPEPDEAGYAHSLGLNPRTVAENFRDYWHAKPGKEAVKLDWSATWRGWCRRDAERSPQRPTARQPESKLAWMLNPRPETYQ